MHAVPKPTISPNRMRMHLAVDAWIEQGRRCEVRRDARSRKAFVVVTQVYYEDEFATDEDLERLTQAVERKSAA